MSRLFEPLSIGNLTLDNRIVIAPMCQYSAENGSATDWHMIHLGSLALSGAGLLSTEATAVSPEGRISPEDLGLYSDANEAAMARVLEAIRAYSPIPVVSQLAHAGRKGSSRAPWHGGSQIRPEEPNGWTTVAPSPVPHSESEIPPHELTESEIEKVKADFSAATKRAARLGFDGIEVHGAHGYLLHEFLSPLSNTGPTATAEVSRTGCVSRSRCSPQSARRFLRKSPFGSGFRPAIGRPGAGTSKARSHFRRN